MTRIRFPHSAIPGSFLAVRSPRLIADFYGLHRYWLSRHPLSVPLITFLCIDLTSNRSSKLWLLVPSLKSFHRYSKLLIREPSRTASATFKRPQRFPRFSFLFVEVENVDLLKLPPLYRTLTPMSTPFFDFFKIPILYLFTTLRQALPANLSSGSTFQHYRS